MLDSTRWIEFAFEPGDIVICSWPKSGTTWLQHIVAQLLYPKMEIMPVLDISPWIDSTMFSHERISAMLKAQTGRRFMKSHLPADALVYSPLARYVFIGRDGRDALWSWYHHHASLSPAVFAALRTNPEFAGAPQGPPSTGFRDYFHEWLEKDGYPVGPFFSHVHSWWKVRHLENVLLLHFADLKRDLAGQVHTLATFLGIDTSDGRLTDILPRCTFSFMKQWSDQLSVMLKLLYRHGGGDLIRRGENHDWQGVLTQDDLERYDQAARANLPSDCALWLSRGALAEE